MTILLPLPLTFDAPSTMQLNLNNSYNVVNVTDMASSYVTALYFTTSSLTSVGFGNVSGKLSRDSAKHPAIITPDLPRN